MANQHSISLERYIARKITDLRTQPSRRDSIGVEIENALQTLHRHDIASAVHYSIRYYVARKRF